MTSGRGDLSCRDRPSGVSAWTGFLGITGISMIYYKTYCMSRIIVVEYSCYLGDYTGGDEMRGPILFLILITVILSIINLSCVTQEVPVIETYYETETRTESYSDVGTTGEYNLTPDTNWYCENLEIQPVNSENPNPWGREPPSSSGVWYFGYRLPEHSSSKIILQTWGEEPESPWNPIQKEEYPLYPWQQKGGQRILAYDVSNVGYWDKPPFDKTLYTSIHYIGPFGADLGGPKLNNVSPEEIKQFNEWLDYFNAQLANQVELDIQFSNSEYQFDTTGIKNIALLIAGNETKLSSSGTNSWIPESSHNNPIKSILLVWSDNVTKQRQVPYLAEKQRTVMEMKKVPFWEAIFR